MVIKYHIQFLLSSILFLTLIILPIGCHTSSDSDGDGWSDAKEATVGTDPHNIDTDLDGLTDPHDGSPLLPNIPTSQLEFKDVSTLNKKLEYAVIMWVKNDMLGIIKELRERIPVPLASDVIEKILRDAIQKSIDWQIIKVGKSPNERDINIRVIFSLSVKLPNVSADNLSDNATKNIGNMTKKLIQRIDLKPYTAGFAYDLTYFDTNIVDDEIDTDSFHWEEVK